MSFEFFTFSEKNQQTWDAFILRQETGSVHQVSDWANFQKTIPGRGEVLGFGVRDEKSKEILATTFAVRMETGVLEKFWFYSARGPVFDVVHNGEAGRFLVEEVGKVLEKSGAMFWRFDPYFSAEDYDVLKFGGVNESAQDYQPTDTLVLDLGKSEDVLLAEMKRKGRYNINLARKNGVGVQSWVGSEVSDAVFEQFWILNNATTSRDGFASHGREYYLNFLKKLSKYAVLFLAFAEDGTPVAGAISTFCGEKAIYYFGASASDPAYRNLMAPYLLQWAMIRFAKQEGCKSYDFLGIAPEGAADHPYAGISEFKWKFGGKRQTFASGKEMVFRSFWYWVYRKVKCLRR